MGQNRICRNCLKSTPKLVMKYKKYCSEACKNNALPKCKPNCTDIVLVEMVYANKTKHIRKQCTKCKRYHSDCLPRNKETKKDTWLKGSSVFPNRYLDF